MTTIEIEDYKGNTIGSFKIAGHIKIKDISLLNEFDIADEDDDYINKEVNLIRIQRTEE